MATTSRFDIEDPALRALVARINAAVFVDYPDDKPGHRRRRHRKPKPGTVDKLLTRIARMSPRERQELEERLA